MKISGLHLLITYQCTFECDHCFVWGSPWQSGTMTLADINTILTQAKHLGTVDSIYFEGGEPFLYYPVLVQGVSLASQMGFEVGMVTNCYWATTPDDARIWLEPFVGLIEDLSLSSDLFHYDQEISRQVQNATTAAEELKIPVGMISVAQPQTDKAIQSQGQLPLGQSGVMYRGRAAEKLVQFASHQSWHSFYECPHEDLREPGRVHIDPLGYVHICQGISLGNLFQIPLKEIFETYDPTNHPITTPLLEGGPTRLSEFYDLPHHVEYPDACNLCYQTRLALRSRFPEILAPDQMYGVVG